MKVSDVVGGHRSSIVHDVAGCVRYWLLAPQTNIRTKDSVAGTFTQVHGVSKVRYEYEPARER